MSIEIRDGHFYTAATARELASYGSPSGAPSIVFREISFIREAIATEVAKGNLSVKVQTSPMTSDSDYFNAWNDPAAFNSDEDKHRRTQMDMVRDYFSFMGYYIVRNRVGTSNNFEWEIKW